MSRCARMCRSKRIDSVARFSETPGRGKPTVARLYGRFLTSLGVIPGACFRRQQDQALANLGVSGCKKLLDDVISEGGGVIFIDEAYQLTSGQNHGGGGVLDFSCPKLRTSPGRLFSSSRDTTSRWNPSSRTTRLAQPFSDRDALRRLHGRRDSSHPPAQSGEAVLGTDAVR